jgi:hypothetical protein
MTAQFRLEGLEPDNLLAFLALLGLLRALEAADEDAPPPRACWDLASPPLRPLLSLPVPVGRDALLERAASGIARLAAAHDFAGRQDLNFSADECTRMLGEAARDDSVDRRVRSSLLAALMSDAAIKDKDAIIEPTPLCLLFGQGHQHFLERLAGVPREPAPPPRGRGRKAVAISAEECLGEALFQPWHRSDPTPSFRWDPEEDVRYALMAGDPTDAAYKTGTQHGANRLAAIGLSALTLVPVRRGGRVRPGTIGGVHAGGFAFAWPIWRQPATLSAIVGLLAHPGLARGTIPGVDHVMVARRISVGKFMNFTRARPLLEDRPRRGE